MNNETAIVIGAGIVGLATARALALKGYKVRVFDRTTEPRGASIRNFGMIWPIGQPGGTLYDRAMRSRSIWQDLGARFGIWTEEAGSLHLAYQKDEWQVMDEFYESAKDERNLLMLTPDETIEKSPFVNPSGLIGALYSRDELIVDPRDAIRQLPGLFSEELEIDFYWNKCVSYVADQTVYIGNKEEYEADLVFICSGSDFETLYPESFQSWPLTKCKLQMMRLKGFAPDERIGPALCGGLSLVHYKSFQVSESLLSLRNRFCTEMPEYIDQGIHVMVSQHASGDLTIGDSHEYGPEPDPFDKLFINHLILDYLKNFFLPGDGLLAESWHGVYAKLTNGETELFFSPEPGVFILTGLGGAGMTLSFGLAEEIVEQI